MCAGGVAIAMVACDPSVSSGGEEMAARAAAVPEAERYGGTAVWASPVSLLDLSPLTSYETNDLLVDMHLLFMPLVRYDENLEPQPWLAQSWDTVRVAGDTLQLTFHLRRDVRWHDGVPTTAEDVKFTFDRILDPRTGFPDREEVAHYRPQAQVIDSFTVRFWLRAKDDPLAPWPWRAIAPRHLLADVPPERLRHHPFARTAPVGNGPFRFVERRDQDWLFEANPDFPADLGGRPYLDGLLYRVVPDETARIRALATGEVDISRLRRTDAVDRLRGRGVRVLSFVSPEWVHIAWNTRLPLFRDARVRRALSMAIDRRQIVDGVLGGHAVVGRSPVTPAHWSYDPDDPEVNLPHDPEGARRLLAEAGWSDRDGDGVLEDREGRELRFALTATAGARTQEDIAEVVQAQLREVGAAVEPRILEQGAKNAQLMGTVNARAERERSFQATIWNWFDEVRKDDSGKLHSRSRNSAFGIAGFEHARADLLMDSLRHLTDREKARPLWREYQRLMVRESPVTVLYYPQVLVAVGPRLRDVEVDMMNGELVNVHRWWLLPSGR